MHTGSDIPDLQKQPFPTLIVDRQILVIELMREYLKGDARVAVAGHALTGLQGVRKFQQLRPSLVITALDLPELNGAEFVRMVRRERPRTKILVCWDTASRGLLDMVAKETPEGMVHRSESLQVFSHALDSALEGGQFRSKKTVALLKENPSPSGIALTPRERSILQLIAEGIGTKEIGTHLGISPKTVEYHRKNLTTKLKLRDVASLTRYAIRMGLVAPSE